MAGGAQAERIEDCLVLASEAVESLRELTRGIYPTNLTRSGLSSALPSRAAAMRRVDALRIDPAVAAARFPGHVEAAAYYCCVEVLEHPGGEVSLTLGDDNELVLVIRGVDVDVLSRSAIVDRIEASGGVLGEPADGALRIRFPGARCSDHTCRRRAALSADLEMYAAAPHPDRSKSSSSWVESRMTTGAEALCLIRRVASMPSMPGRLMSISTRSGRSSVAAATDSSPDATAPTTAKPSVESTTTDIARRNGSWSSTTSTPT